MTEAQFQEIKNRIACARLPEHKLTDARDHIRGWNNALHHVEKIIKQVMGETKP